MKKLGLLFAILVMSFMFAISASANTVTGVFGAEGSNLMWSFDDETGILKISGNGDMNEYQSVNNIPWQRYKDITKKVEICEGVTNICGYAFYKFEKLSSVTISKTVSSIGNCPFESCNNLTEITVDANNEYYSSDELGVLFNKDKSILLQYPIGSSYTYYYISYGTSVIAERAFYGCVNLKSIDMSDSVTDICEYAFYDSKNLNDIYISKGVVNIGETAFLGCTNLKDIIVDVDNQYFSNDEYGVLFNKDKTTLIRYPIGTEESYYYIPDGTITVANRAFYGCINLKSVSMSESVTNIGGGFYGCISLKSIVIAGGVEKINNSAFSGSSNLVSVIIENGVSSIGDYAFSDCRKLVSVSIADTVTEIGERAFWGCTNLKELTLGKGLRTIKNRAFQYYDSGHVFTLIRVDNLYYNGTIEDWCKIDFKTEYSNASGTTPPGPAIKNLYINGELLEELIIPESVTRINQCAFYSITSIKRVVIHKNLKSIGADAFEYTVPETVVFLGKVSDWCSLGFGGSIGRWESRMGSNPVKSNTELYIDGKRVRNLEIPSGVEVINWMVFYCNRKITNVFIPKSVKTINNSAFDGSNLSDVYYEGSEEDWKKITIAQYNDSLTNAKIHYNSSPDDFGYRVRVLVDMPSMTIKEGKTATAIAQLYLNGEVVNDDVEFTVVSSDPSVLSVDNFVADDSSLTFELNAIKPGVVQATVVETLTETAAVTEIEVVTGNIIFNSQYLPTYYERDQAYNCYSSGLYISDFKCGLIDDEYKVTFNAWNALSVMGVVCVYDADGIIKSVTPIKRFEGNMATSIKDALYNGYKLIDDFVWGEVLTFKQDSYTKKTEVEVYVPEGGYIEITNNPMKNDYCATLNYVGFVIEFAKVVGGSYMDLMTYEGFTESFASSVLDEIIKTKPELVNKFIEKVAKKSIEKFSFSTASDVLTKSAEEGLSLLNDNGIDIAKIGEEVFKTFGIDIVEKIFIKTAGVPGFVMKIMFTVSDYLNTTSWFIDLFSQRTEDSIKIWTFDKDGNFCDNGVKGNNVDDEVDLGAQNMVMRSVVISKEDKTEIDFDEVFKKIADEYIVRDIYFQCNGDIMQPGQRIQISIPVPKEFDPELCAIFWVREDGTVEKMDAEYNNGYMQFIATHFSYYAITQLHVHDYTSEVVIEPTCKNNGLKKYTCTCDETYTESIEVNDHSLGSWYVVTPSKCETIGLEQRDCSKCDYSETQEIPATGHDFDGSVCKNCNFDRADSCGCKCHKTGIISKIIWFIINFFNKFLKKNQVCDCGKVHF